MEELKLESFYLNENEFKMVYKKWINNLIKKILKTIFYHNIVNWNYWKGCNCYIHNSVFKVYKLNKLMDLLFGY